MYKVFINDKPIFFITSLEDILPSDDIIIFKGNDKADIITAIKDFEHNIKKSAMYILNDDKYIDFSNVEAALKGMQKIKAAGGLVKNNKDEYLFIFRYGRWDLPKGIAEKGETIEETAQREIAEETGIQSLYLKDNLSVTYHIYQRDGIYILKETHWYFFETDFSGMLLPQTDEGILQAEWFGTKGIGETIIPSSYKTITEVLKSCKDVATALNI